MFKVASKAAIFLAALAFLFACSPKLNWRTVQSPEQRYTALFPGKPDKLERRISYQDEELLQTLEAVKIDDDIYSISSIQLPANQSSEKMIAQLKTNLLERAKASGGSVVVEDAFYKVANNQRLPTQDFFIAFSANGKVQQTMRVRWITRLMDNGANWIYQISVLHASSNAAEAKFLFSQEEYSNFFNEFRPE